jgi:hypothetical protein
MAVKRIGGALPLGEGRVGVPLDGLPERAWMDNLREAMTKDRGEDPVWQHAAVAVTADEVKTLRTWVFPTDGIEDAQFIVFYVSSIDAAIEAANAVSP